MLNVVTLLWDRNEKSHWFSQCYDESWVHKLYNGFKRNLTREFRFVLFTDRRRELPEEIKQEQIEGDCSYASCIQPYRLGQPMILVGLDTVVTGNCDDLADHCLQDSRVGLPNDPSDPSRVCNGVALVPEGNKEIYTRWRDENDMDWMRKQSFVRIDSLFLGQVVSYKGYVKKNGLGNARIVYFHGDEKPHQINEPWIAQHWC